MQKKSKMHESECFFSRVAVQRGVELRRRGVSKKIRLKSEWILAILFKVPDNPYQSACPAYITIFMV